MEGAAAGRCRP